MTAYLEFEGEVIHWRGPSPFHFVSMPDGPSEAVRAIATSVSYGWGCIPVGARIGDTPFTTALIPKDGHSLVPLKDVVRKGTGIADGRRGPDRGVDRVVERRAFAARLV